MMWIGRDGQSAADAAVAESRASARPARPTKDILVIGIVVLPIHGENMRPAAAEINGGSSEAEAPTPYSNAAGNRPDLKNTVGSSS